MWKNCKNYFSYSVFNCGISIGQWKPNIKFEKPVKIAPWANFATTWAKLGPDHPVTLAKYFQTKFQKRTWWISNF